MRTVIVVIAMLVSVSALADSKVRTKLWLSTSNVREVCSKSDISCGLIISAADDAYVLSYGTHAWCAPDGTTMDELVPTVRDFLADPRVGGRSPGVLSVLAALRLRWPCPSPLDTRQPGPKTYRL